jgi:stage II sporulation protein R
VRQDTLRLHILANSDSQEDQALKLLVRDRILEETAEIFSGSASRDEAILAAQEALPRILDTARQAIREEGFSYSVSGKVERVYFNTRQYDSAILPAGVYDAVQIRIGKAEGKNWWCVLFPPLCVGAALPEDCGEWEEGDILSAEESAVMEEIEKISVEFVPKFAAVEWVEEILEKLRYSETP